MAYFCSVSSSSNSVDNVSELKILSYLTLVGMFSTLIERTNFHMELSCMYSVYVVQRLLLMLTVGNSWLQKFARFLLLRENTAFIGLNILDYHLPKSAVSNIQILFSCCAHLICNFFFSIWVRENLDISLSFKYINAIIFQLITPCRSACI